MIFASNNDSYLKNKDFFDWFKPTKILYLNFAKIYEFKSFEEFENNVVDLDMTLFLNDLESQEGFCVYQEGIYYLSFEDGKITLKIDKQFNECFEKLKLSEGENEDIVLAYKKGVSIDLTKNNDFNKMLNDKMFMIFSKIDRSRVL